LSDPVKRFAVRREPREKYSGRSQEPLQVQLSSCIGLEEAARLERYSV